MDALGTGRRGGATLHQGLPQELEWTDIDKMIDKDVLVSVENIMQKMPNKWRLQVAIDLLNRKVATLKDFSQMWIEYRKLIDFDEIVEAAVKIDGRNLYYASDRLRGEQGDRRMAKLAIQQNVRSLFDVTPNLFKDSELIFEVLKNDFEFAIDWIRRYELSENPYFCIQFSNLVQRDHYNAEAISPEYIVELMKKDFNVGLIWLVVSGAFQHPEVCKQLVQLVEQPGNERFKNLNSIFELKALKPACIWFGILCSQNPEYLETAKPIIEKHPNKNAIGKALQSLQQDEAAESVQAAQIDDGEPPEAEEPGSPRAAESPRHVQSPAGPAVSPDLKPAAGAGEVNDDGGPPEAEEPATTPLAVSPRRAQGPGQKQQWPDLKSILDDSSDDEKPPAQPLVDSPKRTQSPAGSVVSPEPKLVTGTEVANDDGKAPASPPAAESPKRALGSAGPGVTQDSKAAAKAAEAKPLENVPEGRRPLVSTKILSKKPESAGETPEVRGRVGSPAGPIEYEPQQPKVAPLRTEKPPEKLPFLPPPEEQSLDQLLGEDRSPASSGWFSSILNCFRSCWEVICSCFR